METALSNATLGDSYALIDDIGKNRLRLLLIEDQDLDSLMLTNALMELKVDIELTRKKNGEECISLLNILRNANTLMPDLIILDLFLEGDMHGTQVLSFIKSDPRLRNIPVIIWTSSLNEDLLQICADTDADNYIHKPQTWEQFKELAKFLVSFMQNTRVLPPVWTTNVDQVSPDPTLTETDISKKLMTTTMAKVREILSTDYSDWPDWRVLMFLSFRVRECLTSIMNLQRMRESNTGLWSNMKQDAPYLENEITKLAESLKKISSHLDSIALSLDLSSGTTRTRFTYIFDQLSLVVDEVEQLFQDESSMLYKTLNQPQAID